MTNSADVFDLSVKRPAFLGNNNWSLKQLTPITIIFGKNGSGKSILLRNIRDQNPDLYNYSVPERGGEIGFTPNIVNEEMDGTRRAGSSKQNLVANYRERVIARIQAYLSKRGAMRTEMSAEGLEYIERCINNLMPDFSFKLQSENPLFSLQRITSNEKVQNITQLSSGEVQLLTLGLDLLLTCEIWKLDGKTGLLLIDEPDSHIHQDMQLRFSDFVVNLYRHYGTKVIIATHNTTLLAALGFFGDTDTSVIYLDKKVEHKATRFNEVLKTLTTCLGGHVLMGPLFGHPILLVEGDDDYRIWSEIPRHHVLQIAVIPCNGDEIFTYQKILDKLFTSILEQSNQPSGYALLDGDQKIPNSNPQHIKFLQLNCHESENLFLTDEVLKELGYDWDSACTKVVHESDNFGQKASELKTISSWDRKNQDCKNVIKEVARILDQKNLYWAYRLGKVLGKNHPTGQLAEFLGENLIKTLWGNE